MPTLNVDACQRVAYLYNQSCTELLAAYGLSDRLRPAPARANDRTGSSYVSVLSVSGDGIRLSSTMDLESGLLSATYPSGGDAPTQRDLEDWCRELNNQLAGRLKNKLLALGCRVMLGLPSLLTGVNITSVEHDDFDTRWTHFTSPDGDLVLTLASHIAPSFVLADEPVSAPTEEAGILFEGGFQLF